MIALLTAATGWTSEAAAPPEPKVIICLERQSDIWTIYRARDMASRMLAGIGVATEWPSASSCPVWGDIVISLGSRTPPSYRPGALAEAFPYEGVHIRVFYDRMQQSVEPRILPSLLAHVLVHEVTHLLEGVSRHSESGVMKALWNENDYFEMASKPLPFAPQDVALIRAGLQKRYLHGANIGSNTHSKNERSTSAGNDP